MSLCRNCQTNISKYECPVCNCCFCLRCDSYIHSFPSKRTHLRRYITNRCIDNFSSRNDISPSLSYQTNYNNYDEPQNIFLYSQSKGDSKSPIKNNENNDDDNDLNNSLDCEQYSKKISSLGDEIINTRENFDNRIEALHEHFHIINENQRMKMYELNKKNLEEIDIISNDKEKQIQKLKEILEEQNEIINQLKEENNNLLNIYNDNKKDIEILNSDKQKLIEDNNIIEDMNTQKINEIVKMNDEEKSKLIEDYNEELVKLKDKYLQTEEVFKNTFKEKQRKLNDYIEDKDREKKELSIMINSLIFDNNNKMKEIEKLKEDNEKLGKIYNEREEQYNSMKDAIGKNNTSK